MPLREGLKEKSVNSRISALFYPCMFQSFAILWDQLHGHSMVGGGGVAQNTKELTGNNMVSHLKDSSCVKDVGSLLFTQRHRVIQSKNFNNLAWRRKSIKVRPVLKFQKIKYPYQF